MARRDVNAVLLVLFKPQAETLAANEPKIDAKPTTAKDKPVHTSGHCPLDQAKTSATIGPSAPLTAALAAYQ